MRPGECCRICHDEASPERRLVSPCNCSGSGLSVHLDCLQRWIEVRPAADDRSPFACEVCGQDYRIVLKHRFLWGRACTSGSMRHAAEGGALVFLLACTVLAVVVLQPRSDESLVDSVILTVMFAATMLVTGLALTHIFRRWLLTSSIAEIHSAPDTPPRALEFGTTAAAGGSGSLATVAEEEEEESDRTVRAGFSSSAIQPSHFGAPLGRSSSGSVVSRQSRAHAPSAV